MAGILKVDKYQDFNGNNIMTSDGSGNITINNTALKNTPAFRLNKSAQETISDATRAKVTYDTTDFDTDSAVSSSTFTAPVAGKYYFYATTWLHAGANSNFNYGECLLYKNGSLHIESVVDLRDNPGHQVAVSVDSVIDMAINDTIEIYASCDDTSGSPEIGGGNNRTYFGGYRIIGA